MPSASSKPENKTSTEVETPIKQAIGAVERKVRNLEKRKGKLDSYQEKLNGGAVLNADQKDALAKYDVVVQSLEFAKELQKQFLSISADAEKMLKKQMKREKIEQQKTELKRFQELLELQAILDHMGSEDVREDFKTGKQGAAVLTEENLNDLDKLYKLINPSREEAGDSGYAEELRQASEHIANFLDGKEKEVIGNTTYKMIKDMVVKINECGYFDRIPGTSEEEKAEEPILESAPQEESPASVQMTSDSHLKADFYSSSDKDTVPVVAQNVDQFEFLGAEEPESTQAMPQEFVPVNNVAHPATLVEESFFNTGQYQQQQQQPQPPPQQAQQQQRPLNEIVDSVQGSFDFLQDSEIDLESPHMDPAVVAAHPMAPSVASMTQTSDANLVQSYQSAGRLGDEQSQSQHAGQQREQDTTKVTTGQSLTSMASSLDPTATVFVSEQSVIDTTYTSQGYSNIVSQTLPSGAQHSYSTDPALGLQSTPSYSAMGGVSSISTDAADVPPAIPMPNQTATLDNQQMSDAESQEKKFTMNADAAVFKSMYSQPTFPDQQDGDRGFEQDGDFQGSDMNQSNYYRGGRGGSRGGRGGNRGGNMSNGYRGRGGNYGGGNRGGSWNNRGGGGNRGNYQGYPPRSDYKPEGYQGSNNGFGSGYGAKRGGGGMRGAPTGRGGPRGTSRGGNQRGRGGFGARPGSGQQQ